MFENVPNTWSIYTLGEITEVVGGGTPSTKHSEYWDGDIPWITPKDLSNYEKKYIKKGERFITSEGLAKSSTKIMPEGTVLFTSRAPIGYVAIAQTKICTNQGFKSFICSEKLLPDFLYYYLKNNKDYVETLAAGTTFKEISGTNAKKIKIPVPPTIKEQKEIVKILDDAAALVQARKKCIEHTEELTPAIFCEMFGDPVKNEKGWEACKFKDVASIDRKNISASDIQENNYSYIGLEHIEKDTGKVLVNSKETKDVEIKSNKFYFTNEHILYGKLRPYLNKVAIPEFNGVCSTDIFPILPKLDEKISNKLFIKYLMSSIYFVNEANNKLSGANLPRIGTDALENIKIFKPDFKLQEKFAQIAIEIEEYKKQQYKELEDFEDLFQSLLQKAFTGDLTAYKYSRSNIK